MIEFTTPGTRTDVCPSKEFLCLLALHKLCMELHIPGLMTTALTFVQSGGIKNSWEVVGS